MNGAKVEIMTMLTIFLPKTFKPFPSFCCCIFEWIHITQVLSGSPVVCPSSGANEYSLAKVDPEPRNIRKKLFFFKQLYLVIQVTETREVCLKLKMFARNLISALFWTSHSKSTALQPESCGKWPIWIFLQSNQIQQHHNQSSELNQMKLEWKTKIKIVSSDARLKSGINWYRVS